MIGRGNPSRLLAKRGKKDFSMKIQYGASGALGYLPMGLQGPAMIGRGNPYLGLQDARHFGTFGSQGAGSFGFAPNYEYRGGSLGESSSTLLHPVQPHHGLWLLPTRLSLAYRHTGIQPTCC